MQFKTANKTYEIEFVEIGGVIAPEARFMLKAIAPALGSVEFTPENIKTHKDTIGIECHQWTEIAKNAAGGKQRVLYSITPDAEQFVRTTTVAETEKFRAAAAAKEIAVWEYAFGGDSGRLYISPVELTSLEASVRQDAVALEKFVDNHHGVRKYLRTHGTKIERDSGLYTESGWRTISDAELQAVVAEARAEVAEERARMDAEKQAKHDALLKQAQETGKPVVIRVRQVPCDDPREECDCDNIVTYLHPDGTTSTTRHHTW